VQVNERCYQAPLPPVLSEEHEQSGPLAPAACPRLPCYCGPVRHPLVFRPLPRALVIGVPGSPDFAGGRGGLLQLLSASWSPCCRSHPAGVARRDSQPATGHTAFTPGLRVGLRSFALSRLPLRSLSLRPVTRWPSRRWRCRWAFGVGFPAPDHPSYGRLALPRWDYLPLNAPPWLDAQPAGRFAAPGFPARFAPRVMGPIAWEHFQPGHRESPPTPPPPADSAFAGRRSSVAWSCR